MDTLLSNCRDKTAIMKNIQNLQLSHQTVARRAELFDNDICNTISRKISEAKSISLCLDESTDINDNSQLVIWIRIVDKTLNFTDEILDLDILKTTTKGIDIFELLKSSLARFNISFDQITSITTDGAAAMTGYKSGLVALVRQQNKNLLSFHCIIHQESLLGKLGIFSAKPMADNVMKITNKLISGGALKHRQFRLLLEENNSILSDLSKMQQVRWLSCQKVFNQFLTILDFIKEFVNQQNLTIPELDDSQWISDLSFFADLTTHFAILNKQLQGNFTTLSSLIKIKKGKIH